MRGALSHTVSLADVAIVIGVCVCGSYGYNASFKTHYMWVAQHPEVKAILTVRDTPDKYEPVPLNC